MRSKSVLDIKHLLRLFFNFSSMINALAKCVTIDQFQRVKFIDGPQSMFAYQIHGFLFFIIYEIRFYYRQTATLVDELIPWVTFLYLTSFIDILCLSGS